jgi:tRNA(fMet)-specific endonuclease VapC
MPIAPKAPKLKYYVALFLRDRLTVLKYTKLNIISLSADAVDLFNGFRKSGIKIGTMDLKMACIAMANNVLFLTANRRDFAKVPGLRFENWLE